MPKVIWKGSLSLGLVNVPIRVFPETRSRRPAFTLVDRRDLAPIGIHRINKKTGETVPREEIARAAALPDGGLALVPEDLLEEAGGPGPRAVRIVAFTPLEEISPVHFQAPYYLEPAEGGEKGYELLLEALRRTRKAAIARTALQHRESLAALWADHSLLMMSVLRWASDLRRPARLTRPPAPPDIGGLSPEEVEMAERLVQSMSVPWNPRAYRDESGERARAWLEGKAGARTAEAREAPVATPQGQMLNFLERSVRSAQEPKSARSPRTA